MKLFYNDMFLEQYTLHKHGHAALDEQWAAHPPGNQVQPGCSPTWNSIQELQYGLEIELGCLVQ